MQHARTARNALAVAVVGGLAALLGLGLVAGCVMVEDSVTGVKLDRGAPTTCVKQCNDTAQLKNQDCKKDHETAREACKLLPEPDRTNCLNAASDARGACMSANNAEKEACQNECHRAGAGSAG